MDAMLIEVDSGEIYSVSEGDEFHIERGTAHNANMLQIDNEKISKRHATIIWEDGSYYLTDNNSKNGTYINACLLNQGDKIKLINGDLLRFSDLNFIFKINNADFAHIKAVRSKNNVENINGRQKLYKNYKEYDVSLYQMKMLENNTDYGLLEMNFFKSDQEYKVYYDIEGLIQLNQYIMGEALEEGKLYKILYNIVAAIQSAEDILIKTQNLCLKTDAIYINPINLAIKLVFIPKIKEGVDVYSSLFDIIREFEHYYNGDNMIDLYITKAALESRCCGIEGLSILLIEQEKAYRQILLAEKRYFPVKQIDEKTHEYSLKETNGLKLEKSHTLNINSKQKLYMIQIFLIVIFAVIFSTELFNIFDFIGFVIVVTGVDLWIMRSLRLI